jgi:hypothetical protein
MQSVVLALRQVFLAHEADELAHRRQHGCPRGASRIVPQRGAKRCAGATDVLARGSSAAMRAHWSSERSTSTRGS